MFKKILSLVLAVLLAVGAMSVPAFAAEAVPSDRVRRFTCSKCGNELAIDKQSSMLAAAYGGKMLHCSKCGNYYEVDEHSGIDEPNLFLVKIDYDPVTGRAAYKRSGGGSTNGGGGARRKPQMKVNREGYERFYYPIVKKYPNNSGYPGVKVLVD